MKITWKQIGFAWLITMAVISIIFMMNSLTKVQLQFKEGMCLQKTDIEFPTCYDLLQVIAVGKEVVLVRKYVWQGNECGYEHPKNLLNAFYKEVPCSCEGFRTCK